MIVMFVGLILGVVYVALIYVLYDGLFSFLVDASSRLKGMEIVVVSGLWFVSMVVFFGGGYMCLFDGLYFVVVFIGFCKFNFYGMGFFFGFETWSGEIIFVVVILFFVFVMI